MRSMESTSLDVFNVTDDYLLVDHGSVLSRPEIMYGIQVRYVNPPLIRRGTFVTVLINIHAEQEDVLTINILEESDTFRSTRIFCWIIFMLVVITVILS